MATSAAVESDIEHSQVASQRGSLRASKPSSSHSKPSTISEHEVRAEIAATPAYMLEWDHQVCKKTTFPTPETFRVALRSGATRSGPRRMFILYGLPRDYVEALLDSDHLNIDPAFIDAHAGRRSYRPPGLGDREIRFMHLEYPELVEGFYAGASLPTGGGIFAEAVTVPEIHTLGSEKEKTLAAVFCRASLWATSRPLAVLLMDRPVWRDPVSNLRKARWKVSAAGSYSKDTGRDEIPSLGDALPDALKINEDPSEVADIGNLVYSALTQIAHSHWLDMFGVLAPLAVQLESRERIAACYWQILHCLEQNIDMSDYLDDRGYLDSSKRSFRHWDRLLSRIHHRTALLPAIPPTMKAPAPPPNTKTKAAPKPPPTPRNVRRTTTLRRRSSATNAPRSSREIMDENQRALDRISYLGGILIPLPIVSSILSMGDTFGPGGSMFYIFWAASIPLSFIAVLVIYADTIRKAEVWVEVAAEQVVAASVSSSGGGDEGGGNGQRHSIWRRRHGKSGKQSAGDEEAQMPPFEPMPTETVEYTVDPQGRVLEETVTAPAADEKVDGETSDGENNENTEAEAELPVLIRVGPEVLEIAPSPPLPQAILERRSDGGKPKAWKRQRLGWYGAAKTILYQKPRYCNPLDTPQGVAAYERPKRRRTSMF
ncbi:hypothetical protein B0T25DRAFT_556114 [Lasiosphaeria hispida]|uniref:Uncharacterized protein n=1 Tax=Lasiosphaeria hispida TaxID=260671 RepID=A0AAJ0H9B4_9PEZI|nr:hypothetical protein B0T25DRAFT_556114 [Lasiosphaeria hispida]